MNYHSTRGHVGRPLFMDILLDGLAADGGLFLPVEYPQVSADTLQRWRGLSYAQLAAEVLQLFWTDVPPAVLQAMVQQSYAAPGFPHPDVTPLRRLQDGLYIQNLSLGPTLAFKDVALQLLGNAFAYALEKSQGHLNILGATSGDTGSAAEYAMRGKPRIKVFMLSPFGRMSPFQTAQMFSLTDPNIHNLAVHGVFDDCQDIVKAVSEDAEFKARYQIGTVNSINWGRISAQVVYYFWGYLRASQSAGQKVSFAVPTGNFGNICAGHIARQMGLPIQHLVLATNENDVLDEFFRTGIYRPRSRANTHATSSPSMDISKASNFERLMFDLSGGNAAQVKQWFTTDLAQHGQFQLNPAQRSKLADYGFISGSSTHQDRLQTIRNIWQRYQDIIDPHTADAMKVALANLEPGVPMVVLETALATKFSATITEAIGREPERPAAYAQLEKLPQRFSVLPAQVQAVKDFITQNA